VRNASRRSVGGLGEAMLVAPVAILSPTEKIAGLWIGPGRWGKCPTSQVPAEMRRELPGVATEGFKVRRMGGRGRVLTPTTRDCRAKGEGCERQRVIWSRASHERVDLPPDVRCPWVLAITAGAGSYGFHTPAQWPTLCAVACRRVLVLNIVSNSIQGPLFCGSGVRDGFLTQT